MELIIISFLAGILTVLAPCVLTLLPVILGGSLGEPSPRRPLIIALSLGVSVIIFTLLLKLTTIFIGLPQKTLTILSGTLILFFGFTMSFPHTWEKLSFKFKLYKSQELIHNNNSAILLGAALGPVFTTCSPTYALIVATVLPQDFITGLINLLSYTLGLVLLILIIGLGGRKITVKFKNFSNPDGWFKKTLGYLLILTGFFILSGLDKELENFILDQGYLGPIQIEQDLLKDI